MVDLLSDSGTTTITPEQLGAMVASLGKEAYGNPEAYETLIATLKEIFGIDTEEWEIYLCLGSDECITPGLSGEVIKFVKENSPLLVKTNFGKYIFRYEERSGFCDEQGGGISEYKKCLVLIEKLKELKGKE
ncbi:hypothetical protein HYT92_03565 [Candidatus Pacearchaeota archaeon]|nr:hypothetical protein [Candidatus Pacearchaeota archaeon]